jgi:hypothetical protein
MGAPIGHGRADDADDRSDQENDFHLVHGVPPSSQYAQAKKEKVQKIPSIVTSQLAWPVTAGLTTVSNRTPLAMSYRNLAELSR